MKLILLLTVIAVSVATQLELQEEWQFWKDKHGKRYGSAEVSVLLPSHSLGCNHYSLLLATNVVGGAFKTGGVADQHEVHPAAQC